MKKILALMMAVAVVCFGLTGCSQPELTEQEIQTMVEDSGLTILSYSNCGFQGEDTPMNLLDISIVDQQMQDQTNTVRCQLSLDNEIMTAEVYYELHFVHDRDQGWFLESWPTYQQYKLTPKRGVDEEVVQGAVYDEYDLPSPVSRWSFEITENELDLYGGGHSFTVSLGRSTSTCFYEQEVWVTYHFDQGIGEWILDIMNESDDIEVLEWHPHGRFLLNISTFYTFFSIDTFDPATATAQISSAGSVWENTAAYYAMNHYYEDGEINNSDVVQTVTVGCTIKENEIEFEPFRVNDVESMIYSTIHLVVTPSGVYYYTGDNRTREDSRLLEADSFDTLEYLNSH